MTASLALGFAMGWLGSMPLAGAVSIFVFQRGLSGQRRRGLLLAAGAALAEAVWCLVALVGTEEVLHAWPAFETVARILGGLILLVLGAYFLARRGTIFLPTPTSVSSPIPLAREFWLGFTLVAGNLSIPFTWLGMFSVVLSLGMDPMAGPPLVFVLGVALGIMGWFALLLRILGGMRARFQPRALGLVMKAMGLVLLVVGAYSLLMMV